VDGVRRCRGGGRRAAYLVSSRAADLAKDVLGKFDLFIHVVDG
jgi:hypothetical protein